MEMHTQLDAVILASQKQNACRYLVLPFPHNVNRFHPVSVHLVVPGNPSLLIRITLMFFRIYPVWHLERVDDVSRLSNHFAIV